MPSCALKLCKNNSCVNKKSAGITFHMFPTDLIWKEKWIKVVRDHDNDAEWLPSKFSVVCSIHFEEEDIYITKGGLRRIKKNANNRDIHFERIRSINKEFQKYDSRLLRVGPCRYSRLLIVSPCYYSRLPRVDLGPCSGNIHVELITCFFF